MIARDLRHFTRVVSASLLLALLSLSAVAEPYIDKANVDDAVLIHNIFRMVDFIKGGRDEESRKIIIIGKEKIDFSRYRVWYCLFKTDGKKQCGSDVTLITLDTGRWVIQDETSQKWLLMEKPG